MLFAVAGSPGDVSAEGLASIATEEACDAAGSPSAGSATSWPAVELSFDDFVPWARLVTSDAAFRSVADDTTAWW